MYLEPPKTGRDFTPQALHLLNNQMVDLDIVDVLKIIPSHWRVQAVDSFLRRAIRRDIHTRRSLRIQRNLAQ